MSDTGYLISEAAKITEVDAHVLRYWEEELELPIARNKMGHRYYTRQDIQIFQDIKELKKKGLQLRAIKDVIHRQMEAAGRVEIQPGGSRMAEGRREFDRIAKQAAEKEKKPEPAQRAEGRTKTEKEPVKEESRQQQFQEILARVVKEVIVTSHQEGRYKRLDEAIRRHQETRRMVAVTEEGQKKRRHGKKTKDKNRAEAGRKDG